MRGWTFSLAIFVNKENPLESLTLQQVDGIGFETARRLRFFLDSNFPESAAR